MEDNLPVTPSEDGSLTVVRVTGYTESLEGGRMKNRVWRPLNTYGLLVISVVALSTVAYSVAVI
jgi:hypothetical protein